MKDYRIILPAGVTLTTRCEQPPIVQEVVVAAPPTAPPQAGLLGRWVETRPGGAGEARRGVVVVDDPANPIRYQVCMFHEKTIAGWTPIKRPYILGTFAPSIVAVGQRAAVDLSMPTGWGTP